MRKQFQGPKIVYSQIWLHILPRDAFKNPNAQDTAQNLWGTGSKHQCHGSREPNTPIPVRGTPARNLLLWPDALLPATGNPSPGGGDRGGDREGSPKQNPPSASRKLLMLSKLILLLLAKFFEGKKANKKTHSSKGTQLIFFHPLKLDRKRKPT